MLRREDRNRLRKRRHLRIRRKIVGTPERPRLAVFRSLNHIYAQVIDDVTGRTVTTASTVDPEVRDQVKALKKTDAGTVVGELVARRAKARGVVQVVFDRSGYDYHGRVKALAEGARRGGLEF